MNKIFAGVSFAACMFFGTSSAHAEFAKAEPKGATKVGCAAGSFLDLRNGGECWKCPSGYDRTVLYPVNSDKACLKPSFLDYEEASFKHSWGCDGDEGEFFDPCKGGECWKCPKKRPRRTAYSVTSDKACATKNIVGESLGEASFEHKFKGCSGRAFYDPRKGGQCWACPKGYDRTADAVTSKTACSKSHSEDYEKATMTSSTCPAGAFADPNGTCYACPSKSPLRTIYPVTSDRACATTLQEAFVPDLSKGQEMCKAAVSALDKALKEGEKASNDLAEVVKPLIEPIRKPLADSIGRAVDKVASKTKLDDALDELEKPVDPYVEDATTFAKNLSSKQSEIRSVLLDPKIMCSGDAKMIAEAIKKHLPKMGSHFVTVSLTASFKHPSYVPRVDLGLTFATNLDKKGGLYFSVGLNAGVPVDPSPLTVTLSGALYPNRKLSDFALSPIPEIALSFAKGGSWDQVVKRFPPLSALGAVDSLDVAWDWDTNHIPAFGISKELFNPKPGGRGAFAASGAIGWGIPIVTYDM